VLRRFNFLLVFALKMVARSLTNCLKELLDSYSGSVSRNMSNDDGILFGKRMCLSDTLSTVSNFA
jgi:hypothetical protein